MPKARRLCTAPAALGAWIVERTETPLFAAHAAVCGDLLVADLADHRHVRRLPQHAAQDLVRAEVDRRVDLRLAQPVDGVLDRVLDRVDLALAVVQVRQRRVERDGLARCRSGR